MRHSLSRILWLSAIGFVASFAAMAIAPSFVDSMKGALERSPDHYISALIEYGQDVVCEEAAGETTCHAPVRVVQQFAARTPDGRPFPATFALLVASTPTGATPSGRALVFAIPFRKPDLFGAKAAIASPDPSEVRIWASATAAATGN